MQVPQITPEILHLIAQLDEAEGAVAGIAIEIICCSTRIDVVEKKAVIGRNIPNDTAS